MRIFPTLFSLLLLLGTATLVAQNDGQAAIDYLRNKHEDLGLTAEDVAELEITDNYVSPGGVRHIYVNQQYRGLSVNNAQVILHFRGDQLVASNNGFVANLADYGLPLAPAVSAQQAISEAVNTVSPTFGNAVLLSETDGEMSFSWSAVSQKPLLAKLMILPTDEGARLAWRIVIDQHADRADYWLMMIDATDGRILDKDNLVLKCDFGTPHHTHNYNTACAKTDATAELPVHEQLIESFAKTTTVADGASYRVFPFGEESPLHSDGRVLEVDPADSIASPFGWHDTNGLDGPEFTITRGNNVYAYPDRDDNDDTPDPGIFADGGDELVFDYYFADEENEDTILNASLTQVFYTTNKVHDWLYHAGFDEEGGNFQRNNYKGGGVDRDPIMAEAQDGSGTNNANFFTPEDGQSGVMQMFLWEETGNIMTVTEPASVSGPYTTGTAGFGPVIGSIPTTGQLVEVAPALACDPVTNGNEIAGKMALITRGTCNFSLKVFNAQEAGAVGVVICNDAMEGSPDGRGGTIGMSNGNPELTVTIPSVFLSFENCQPLRVSLAANDSISVTFRSTAPPPRDGDFDNGIVAHEIGHGVSNRLVGGPSNIGCVFNGESLGEGWSDFFTLASTPQTLVDNPDGSEPRGIGNYSTRGAIDGAGIREKRYSTDFAINDFTYDNFITANNASPHNRGEVWAVTLWDLYWAMTEEYGYDDDLIHGTGGNNKAVELVIEGMKATRCGPGAIDARDGILQADELINDGANQCLIWEVFARRGMGFSADQGSAEDPTDNVEAFDLSPYCIGGVHLTKTADVDVINAGEGVTYTLKATNFRDSVTSTVTITDQIPAGMTFEEGSVRGNDNFTVEGNTITFNVGEMEFEDEETIIYSVTSDPELGSTSYFFDGSEDGDDNWELESLDGNVLWEQTDTTPYEGVLAWYIVNVPSVQDQVLRTFQPVPVTGDNPALRFFTKYETEAGWDAGIVEVSTDNSTWTRVPDNFVRGGYRGEISADGSAALQGTTSFWGNSGGYVENIIDLSAYANQSIYFRFRFISDAAVNARGWWIDNIELLDVVNYESAAILTSDQGDNFRAEVGNLGVLALGGDATDTDDPQLGQTQVSVFPNPANEVVNVNITAERAGEATVQLFSIDGRAVFTNTLNLAPGATLTTINTSSLPAGVYVVQVTGDSRVSTTKVTIQ
ncbi:M36 family metallopeptidase [Neolewinella agarilytica]|uniref:Conserved repeat domain-containing protein/Por secretion system C-terminal sorting domain-containing protein n=1 Tax=Neolewinella agarilytica TaxID=478744 RepID=A0A1H9FD14_9BACT|nr:M36 family metallopeptidase [Neolewinella agarilytica]SEQ35820.1 conserved repeat domain-containing protein/Por secretion system C-terminal sorting domain-containing protein [Neolewinella agarilytica]